MKAKILWTPRAREDLVDIYQTIGFENPTAAERLYLRIEAKTGLLASHPRLGSRCPEIASSARMLVERPYLMLYETHPDDDEGPVSLVEIVRIVDGRRDLTILF